jgi:16S rRNA (cytosine967-C5)-methyltransferase
VTAARQSGRRQPRPALDEPRRVALDVLRAVAQRDAYANLQLAALLRERHLAGRAAAQATELVSGTLRRQGTYDAVLAECVDRPLDRVDPDVLAVLRLGAHQLLGAGVPPHAAVATSVDLARSVAGPRVAGFVNAVLRRVATRVLPGWLDRVAPPAAADPVGSLAVRTSHPRWIVEAFAAALAAERGPGVAGPGDAGHGAGTGEAGTGEARSGASGSGRRAALPAELGALLAADDERPAVTLVARPGRSTVAELVAGGAVAGRFSPWAATLSAGDPAAVAAVRTGRAGVQDEGSQLVCLALAAAPVHGRDERWLDLCAGPGGKAALLAGLAAGRQPPGGLVAAERYAHRARLVSAALAGGPGRHQVVVADGRLGPWPDGAFDRVLADVPCTGLGALRRRPEARWRRTPADLDALRPLQEALLAAALRAVRPGGVVGYVTCSPHLVETRDVVAAALAGRADVEQLDARPLLPGVPDLGPGPHVQLWPHRHGTDGMYLAVLRRLAAPPSPVPREPAAGEPPVGPPPRSA